MTADEFIYRGSLAETPLPEMLATIHRHKVPGVMELEREETTKRIYIVEGDIIFATSSNRDESLGEYLVRRGKITKTQARASSDELLRQPGKRHGVIMVEMGLLQPEELGTTVRDQVQAILWDLFDWEDGDVSFRVGRFRDDEVYKIKIPTPRAILSGCRHISDGRSVTGRLGGRQTVFRPLGRPEHLADLWLEAGEQQLLDLVDGRRTFLELCEQGPFPPGTNARMVYALTVLGLIEPERAGASGIRMKMRTEGT